MNQSTLRAHRHNPPFYRDSRILALLMQGLFVLIIVLIGTFLINNLLSGLRASRIPLSWRFLQQEAGFEIAEGLLFHPSQSYARAFVVGLFNTLRVAFVGIILATVWGLLVGIARLSNNWLVRNLAGLYIEIVRNTPLLVQLFFWYFAVILKLPDIQATRRVGDWLLLSNRGLSLTWPRLSATGQTLSYWLLAALLVALVVGYVLHRRRAGQGRTGGWGLAVLSLLLVVLLGYAVTALQASLPPAVSYTLQRGDRGVLYVDRNGNGAFDPAIDQVLPYVPVTLLATNGAVLGKTLTDSEGAFRFVNLSGEGATVSWETPPPIVFDQPVLQGFNYRGGERLTPEYTALLLGLTIYTAAFIAEVVRAGIRAVAKGQWEASRALGLTSSQMLRLVILPQALRVIIPPLTSQYLNLTKNSSLAIAVGYPDLFNVSRTIFNQSGATVQMFVLLMGTYLLLSLLTSAFMNWYNKRVMLVER